MTVKPIDPNPREIPGKMVSSPKTRKRAKITQQNNKNAANLLRKLENLGLK